MPYFMIVEWVPPLALSLLWPTMLLRQAGRAVSDRGLVGRTNADQELQVQVPVVVGVRRRRPHRIRIHVRTACCFTFFLTITFQRWESGVAV